MGRMGLLFTAQFIIFGISLRTACTVLTDTRWSGDPDLGNPAVRDRLSPGEETNLILVFNCET